MCINSATGLGVVATDEEKREKLIKEGLNAVAVREEGAEVLILGCSGMSGLYKIIEKIVKLSIIAGLVCALMMVESLVKYGVEASKIAKYM